MGSARRLNQLCRGHDPPEADRWLWGGVSVNCHTLSNLRVSHQGALDQALTEIMATLTAQDG